MLVDHFVWVTSNLLDEMHRFSQVFGVQPEYGGRHPGKGTHNALLSLGDECYLELLAPDPGQTVDHRWIIGERSLDSGLLHWAWKATDLGEQVKRCAETGWILGGIQKGERLRADQSLLQWSLTDPGVCGTDFQPFLIEWSSGQHPTDGLEASCHIHSIILQHPTPDTVAYIRELQKWPNSTVEPGPIHLAIQIEAPKGNFILQSGSNRIFAKRN